MLMLSHVEEYFAASLHIFGLDDKPLPWLDHHSPLWIHIWFAIRSQIVVTLGCVLCIRVLCLGKQLHHFWWCRSILDLLIDLHNLLISQIVGWLSLGIVGSVGIEG
jgi:hypothetical protein